MVNLQTAQSPDRIRLLNMPTSFGIDGMERRVVNLAPGLDPSRFDLCLACRRNTSELLTELAPLPVPPPVFRIGRLYAPRGEGPYERMVRVGARA